MAIKNIIDVLRKYGYCFASANSIKLSEVLLKEFSTLRNTWDRLPVDEYMADGGKYRLRRYDRLRYTPGTAKLEILPNMPFFQDKNMNQFAGGVQRKFAPLEREFAESNFLSALIIFDFNQLPISQDMYRKPWEVKVHQIRIRAAADNAGKPSPEGPHKDGGKFFALHLISKHNIIGAENRIYDNDKNVLKTLTLKEPLDSLYVENVRVYHDATPIQVASGKTDGTRDVLILGFWPPSD